MRILQCTYYLLTFCGCFPPPSWTTPFKKCMYYIYAVFTLLLLNSFLLSQMLDAVFNVGNQDELCENIRVTLVVLCTIWKISTILVRRANIARLVDWLQKEPFLPVNAEENEIHAKFEKITDWHTIGYVSLLLISSFWIYGRSIVTDFKSREFSTTLWVPYDYSPAWIFVLTYLHQLTAATVCSISCVAGDSLYSGLLIHIYCQFEILEHRLKNITQERGYTVKLCVRHHDRIYKFAEMVNGEFKVIVFIQFCTSMFVLCFNLYRMSQIKMDARFVEMALYTICTLTQIFYYCWYGNEVKLKSVQLSGAIFESDWMSLNNSGRKAFQIMMVRAIRPLELNTGQIISVDLECFMAVLKTSYSTFNVLQQSGPS
ncbi:unnamed protein product [Xylocopa violacea]|uniref:Odorant receptor n=1 Tax=Xylocopa violacea TaxID=135666 RepID=A0ABP1PBG6_XYLVO